MKSFINIAGRNIGEGYRPLVIAEMGINHNGEFQKAVRMIHDAAAMGCECLKLQCHVIEDEMIPNDVVPPNAEESIWDMMKRCSLSMEEEKQLIELIEEKGMICLSTPFSRAAADRLAYLGIKAFKIGSGECNNYPLVEHIASFGKPVILSTGMNDIASIQISVNILRRYKIPFAVLHCTSMYPTPYEHVRLGAMLELRRAFSDAVIGLSDHSMGNYTSFAAVALGASLVEKHFTADKTWCGSDTPISINPNELQDLIKGSNAIYKALGGTKSVLAEELPCAAFAFATVVTIRDIKKGEMFSKDNLWVKRPGTGEIHAREFKTILGTKAYRDIPCNTHLRRNDIES